MKHFYLFISFFLLSLIVSAQNPYAIKISENENLPNKNVFDIIQDSNGFIWLTSSKGLSKYNGISFINYKTNNQTSLAGSSITEDRFG